MSILFSAVAAWILYFHQKYSRAPSSPHPLHRIFCWLFDDGHSYWCEMVSHCSFDLHFSNNLQCWASFHVPKKYTFWTFFFQIKSKEINPRWHNNCHINHSTLFRFFRKIFYFLLVWCTHKNILEQVDKPVLYQYHVFNVSSRFPKRHHPCFNAVDMRERILSVKIILLKLQGY